jgi:hypothetical protein
MDNHNHLATQKSLERIIVLLKKPLRIEQDHNEEVIPLETNCSSKPCMTYLMEVTILPSSYICTGSWYEGERVLRIYTSHGGGGGLDHPMV